MARGGSLTDGEAVLGYRGGRLADGEAVLWLEEVPGRQFGRWGGSFMARGGSLTDGEAVLGLGEAV